ncbi:rhomboid family intramembrane serine protease [Chachezhania sediminis]|uniref:rhomboid family intramembrane serine protease n=1 Tax=Chachezhania sediminis TaxID=2599291 RepID=UPI00131E6CEE|nr:rhomboid family intramembrane serine protease [Chachezhania sediminis]
MFPIRDHNPSGRTPYVVYALIAANVLIFLSYVNLMGNERALQSFFFDWALIPARLETGSGYGTLLSSMFLHGGFMHLAGNMLFLWVFGDNLEDQMGHGGFALFYLACGIGAGLVHVLFSPGSIVPTVGASGAIAGVMGGYLLLYPKARVDLLLILIVIIRIIPVPAWIVLAVWFAMQFVGSIGSDAAAGGIAYWAHTGGFVVGFLLTVPIWLRLGGPGFWTRTAGHPAHPQAEYRFSQSRIPKVPRGRRPGSRKSPWG